MITSALLSDRYPARAGSVRVFSNLENSHVYPRNPGGAGR